MMYSLDQVRSAIRDPKLVIELLNRKIWHYKSGVPYNANGINIFDEDWDNLIILDACRYDSFANQVNLEGSLDSRESRGAMSEEFIRGNFHDRQLHDVVYVSANHWFSKINEEINAEVFIYLPTVDDGPDGLTTLPQTVTAVALEQARNHPDKRLIIHYMQPHKPFLGPTGRELDYEKGVDLDRIGVDSETIRQAYHENLDLVLEEVESLLPELKGKTVITADHGEMLGERERPIPIRSFGHPKGVHVEPLISVPWFVCDYEERKEIVRETPVGNDVVEDVDERLKNLGYKI